MYITHKEMIWGKGSLYSAKCTNYLEPMRTTNPAYIDLVKEAHKFW